MREHKYRAWDGLRMTTSGIMFNTTNGTVFTASDMPIMQYTGLKDKHGKEIYDKSIIKWGDSIYLIIWCEKCISFSLADIWGDYSIGEYTCENCEGLGLKWSDFIHEFTTKNLLTSTLVMLDDIEVIGNIYENLELLKEQSK